MYNWRMPKHRFQVYLEHAQVAKMRRIEATTGAPVAAQIRLAVDAWLAKQGAALKRRPR